MLGFVAPPKVARVNVTRSDDALPGANDPAVATALDRLTRLDQAVYAAALKRYSVGAR